MSDRKVMEEITSSLFAFFLSAVGTAFYYTEVFYRGIIDDSRFALHYVSLLRD